MVFPKHLDIHDIPSDKRKTVFIGFRNGMSVMIEVPSVGERWRAHALEHGHFSIFSCSGLLGGGGRGILILRDGREAVDTEGRVRCHCEVKLIWDEVVW